MPESGFLISCASMAASAITERAAPRCVSWRSILSAMVRSCSMTTTWSCRSGSGATCRSTRRSPGLRGVPRSTLYSLTAAPRARTCSISASTGLPNGTRSRSRWRRNSVSEASKKDSAAALALAIFPSAETMNTGCGSASRMASDVPEGSVGIGVGVGSSRLMPRSSRTPQRPPLAAESNGGGRRKQHKRRLDDAAPTPDPRP